jgi:hypothetical protein
MKSKVIFSKVKGLPLKEKFKTAKKFIKEGDIKSADVMLDLCIVHLSKETLNEVTEIDGVDINLWKTRVWTAVEKAGLLPD